MQKLKRAFAAVCFVILFFACGAFLRYILVDDSSSYTRVMMHELYTQEENIDVLFVGSSHCYRSLDPRITDRIFGANTFNVGTSSQQIDGSLTLIKEAAKDNDIKQIYLEMYYEISEMPAYDQRTDMVSTYIISDYMHMSLNRFQYLLGASSKAHYSNSFLPARRNWEKIFEPGYVQSTIRAKSAHWYKDYSYPFSATERYEGKGYVSVDQQGNGWSEVHFDAFDRTLVSQDYIDTLMEIIAFCQENEIELTLFTAPMPEFRLVDDGGYDTYIQYVRELVAQTGIKYYDFNLGKSEYLPMGAEYYADTDHINGAGAQMFSEVFARFFTGQIPEDELFYDSYAERIAQEERTIYGIVGEYSEGGSVCTLKPVTNMIGEEITYTVSWLADGEEAVLLQERSANPVISLPPDVPGRLQVTAFVGDEQMYTVAARKEVTAK